MKLNTITFFCLSLFAFMSCEDSASEEFEDANPDAVARYIETVTTVSAQDPSENTTITVNYDTNNRVSSITDGVDSSIFVYSNNELSNISGQGDNLNIEELYESPYDAFETGEVTQYDGNGNPTMITFFETEYEWSSNGTETETELEYTAEITYDANPNPYFYTMQAAGIIAVLDNVDLNLSMNATSAEVVQARMLLPLNNITGITYRDEDGEIVFDLEADYVYNSDSYPVSGTLTTISYDVDWDGNPVTETSIYSAEYTYRN